MKVKISTEDDIGEDEVVSLYKSNKPKNRSCLTKVQASSWRT